MLPYINYYKDVYNIGDIFSEEILSKMYDISKLDTIGNRKTMRFIGSEIPTKGWLSNDTLCCGMGWRVKTSKLDTTTVTADTFKYTRGKISRQRVIDAGVNISPNLPVGDSGLLASLLFHPDENKIYDVLILTHFTDGKNIPKYKESLLKKYKGLKIICYSMGDKTMNCEKLFDVICKSKIVLSSSLHGIIFSHSFGTPALYITCFNGQKYVDSYKFEDYYSVYDRINYNFKPENNTFDRVIEKIYDKKYVLSVNPTKKEVSVIQNNILSAMPYKESFSDLGLSLLNKSYNIKAAVVAIARLENPYINEWCRHHINLGFNMIYIYDNSYDDEEHIDGVIEQDIKNKVTVIPAYNKKSYQKSAYNDSYNKFGSLYDFIMYIDIDEFLVLKKHNTIQEYLKYITEKTPNVENIKIHWDIYDDNNIIERDIKIPVMESFTRRGTFGDCISHNFVTKSIVKCGIEDLIFNHVHFPIVTNRKLIIVNGDGEIIDNRNNQIVRPRAISTSCINHYVTKSISEYMSQKLKRGDADGYIQRDINNRFFNYCDKTSDKIDYYNKHKND